MRDVQAWLLQASLPALVLLEWTLPKPHSWKSSSRRSRGAIGHGPTRLRVINSCDTNVWTCRIQARAEEWQRAAGLLPPEPQLLTYQATKPEPVPEPALMSTVQGDPEAFMTLNLSRNLNQGTNPAYQLRDGFQIQSCMKADFNWDQEEVSFATFMTVAGWVHAV